jgi:hypothetical protein
MAIWHGTMPVATTRCTGVSDDKNPISAGDNPGPDAGRGLQPDSGPGVQVPLRPQRDGGGRGYVEDDLYLAGGMVIVLGRVEGEVIAAGGEINIGNEVTENVIAAGG